MNIRLSPAARIDRERLADFLVTKSPGAAIRAIEQITAGIRSLEQFPERGRVAGSGRELYVPFGDRGYVVQYRVDADAVFVIRILHMREDRSEPT